VSRRCFLLDCDRLILPAYGTYTGGLRSEDAALTGLMRPEALAILTGPVPRPIPMPR
jgi:metallophosphoesterase superfamily enzyme